MKKLISILLLLPSLCIAAEDKEIWACQGTNATGFIWESGNWERRGFNPETFLFTVDGESSKQTINGTDFNYICSGNVVASCTSLGSTFVLDTDSGEGAFADLLSVASSPQLKTPIYVELVQCTKF